MIRRSALTVMMSLTCRPALALYDPKPDGTLASVQGEWKGTLTYRDYSQPDRLVTLPTRLFVALGSPTQLVLHYVFDDGPGKQVFSYERMNFDFAERRITWESGKAGTSVEVLQIKSSAIDDNGQDLSFEKTADGKLDRYTMRLSPRLLRLAKDEIAQDGTPSFRNKFQFERV